MRPLLSFIGFVMMIPGWDLLSSAATGLQVPRFTTPAGAIFWMATGGSRDIHLVHLTGLLVLISGAVVAVTGIITSSRDAGTGEPVRQ